MSVIKFTKFTGGGCEVDIDGSVIDFPALDYIDPAFSGDNMDICRGHKVMNIAWTAADTVLINGVDRRPEGAKAIAARIMNEIFLKANSGNGRSRKWETTGSTSIQLGMLVTTVQASNVTRTSAGGLNFMQRRIRTGFVSAATINTGVVIRNSGFGARAGDGGTFKQSFGIAVNDAASKLFCGLYPSPAAITIANEPSTLTNVIALVKNSTDTNMKLRYHNGTTGADIDLGANFPATSSNLDWYEVIFEIARSAAFTIQGISYTINRYTSAGVKFQATGTIPALPTDDTYFNQHITFTPTTATALTIDPGMMESITEF